MSFGLCYHEPVSYPSPPPSSSVKGRGTCRERRDARHGPESTRTGCDARACRRCRPENPRVSWLTFWQAAGKSFSVPRATRRQWSSGYSPREADADHERISHRCRHCTWSGSHLGGVGDVRGMTMNTHPIGGSSDASSRPFNRLIAPVQPTLMTRHTRRCCLWQHDVFAVRALRRACPLHRLIPN